MNLEKARFNMIEQQIRPWDVLDQDVLALLMVVKREAFVPAAYKGLAFFDSEIPLSAEASMLTPKVEARIVQDLAPKKHETVLVIGAGSGYLAALLAHKSRQVTAVEIDPALVAMAKKNLAENGVDNVNVVEGDGAHGWTAGDAQYDVIAVTGSLPLLPDAFLKQLKVGGRLFAVVGEAPVMTAQRITRVTDVAYHTDKLFETVLRPLRNAETPSHFKF